LPHGGTQQAAKALGWRGLDVQEPQVRLRGELEGFGMRIEGRDALAEPVHERCLVFGTKGAKPAVVKNLHPMPPARPASPAHLGVHFRPHPSLLGEVGDDTARNVFAALGKAAVTLKRLEQDGKRSTGGAGFVGEQRRLVA